MILELRIGGGGKGAQTVFPGSVHETGELIAWDEKENIARAEGDSLKQRCGRAVPMRKHGGLIANGRIWSANDDPS